LQLRNTVKISQYDRAIVLGYGEMLFSFKKYAKCKEVYEGYLRINPNDAEIWSLLKKSSDILEKLAKLKTSLKRTHKSFAASLS
jgi:predicted Zn-dependent protease